MQPRRQAVPFGKYLLLDRINVGGMAEVWRGKTSALGGVDRLVAVKRILPNIAEDEEFVTMFMDEAKITVQLTHANIAQIYDFSYERTHNSYFIAMEYVAGKDLRAVFDRCRKVGWPAPVPLVCYVMSKVCDALDYAHRKKDSAGRELNIVHRDISPQNVLISYEGDVKVIDFGVAKAAGKATRTQAGILKGKFGYMSPEQARAQEIDRRSDIFAIGVCLHELLTGERLFTGETDFVVLDKVRSMEIPPPSRMNPAVLDALDTICLKALDRDVNVRYPYASEMSEDLQRFLLSSNSLFARKDLATFMRSTFAEDVEKEAERVASYADLQPLPPAAPLPPVQRRSDPSSPAPSTQPLVSALEAAQASLSGPPRGSSSIAVIGPAPKLRHHEGSAMASISGDERTQAVEPTSISVPPSLEAVPDTARSSAPTLHAEPSNGRAQTNPAMGGVNSIALTAEPIERTLENAVIANRPSQDHIQAGFARLLWLWNTLLRLSPRDKAIGGGVVLLLLTLSLVAAVSGGRAKVLQTLCVQAPESVQGRVHLYVNDEDLGTPKDWPVLYRVAPGTATVRAQAAGFHPFEVPVEVKPGGLPPVLHVRLVPQEARAPLVVATAPVDAEIRLDEQPIRPSGDGRLYTGEIPAGKEFLLKVSAPGFQNVEKLIHAEGTLDAQVMKVELEREHEEFTVHLTSKPLGALVYAKGQLIGRSPMSFKTSGGMLTLKQRCYQDKQEPIPTPSQPNGATALHVELHRLGNCR
jgi:serine/threonine protein kinase